MATAGIVNAINTTRWFFRYTAKPIPAKNTRLVGPSKSAPNADNTPRNRGQTSPTPWIMTGFNHVFTACVAITLPSTVGRMCSRYTAADAATTGRFQINSTRNCLASSRLKASRPISVIPMPTKTSSEP